MNLIQLIHNVNLVTPRGQINKNAKKIIRNNPSVCEAIYNATSFIHLPVIDSINERIHCIINGITETPKCIVCRQEHVKFVAKQYQTYCGSKCANADPARLKQVRATNIDRYGGPAPMCSRAVKDKTIATNLEKYGVRYHQLSSVGSDMRKHTNQRKYGGPSPFHSQDVRGKASQTFVERYNDTNFNRSTIPVESLSLLTNQHWLHDQHVTQQRPVYIIAKELGVSTFCVGSYLHMAGIQPTRYTTSQPHKDIVAFLRNAVPGVNIIENDRTVIGPWELDIVLPDYNIAIEVNGVYWHSEGQGKGRDYHISKTQACAAKDIRLIHIYDVEWERQSDIVQSRIKCALSLSRRVYARQCEIAEISKAQGSQFLQANHIQGNAVGATIYVGLFHNGELISAMSFCKPRYNTAHEWEILRFSTIGDTVVVGGASKLFKMFVDAYNPSSVVSYSDVRWNSGAVYEKMGFTYVRRSPPSYSYFHTSDPHDTWHRSSFQKHKLERKLETFDKSLSEWKNMQQNGYDRVWDCGTDVWSWQR